MGIPALGIRGAALSTVISTATTCVAALYILSNRENIIEYKIPSLVAFYASIRKVLYVAISAAFNQVSSAYSSSHINVSCKLHMELKQQQLSSIYIKLGFSHDPFVLDLSIRSFYGAKLWCKDFSKT